MPAYVSRVPSAFVEEHPDVLVADLNRAYANDGFTKQYVTQTKAWDQSVLFCKGSLGMSYFLYLKQRDTMFSSNFHFTGSAVVSMPSSLVTGLSWWLS